ncbi:hypothetical protein AAHB43_00845 [Staphylococcus pseudintermedius]
MMRIVFYRFQLSIKNVYDYTNVAFSLPTRVNRDGHHEIFPIQLDAEEKQHSINQWTIFNKPSQQQNL